MEYRVVIHPVNDKELFFSLVGSRVLHRLNDKTVESFKLKVDKVNHVAVIKAKKDDGRKHTDVIVIVDFVELSLSESNSTARKMLIRRLAGQKVKQVHIAMLLGVTQSYVSQVVTGNHPKRR